MSLIERDEYARRNREALDAKVRELRAEGWDVVARRERDLALSERDSARDDLEGAVVLDDAAIERAALALAREPGWNGVEHDANEAARRILVALGGQ